MTTNAIRQALKRKLENTAEKPATGPAPTSPSPSASSGSFVTPNHSDASEDESDLPPRKRQYVRNPDQLESHAALQKQLHQLHHKQQQQQQLLSGSGAPTPPPSEFSGSEDETTKSGSDEERCYFQGAPQRESVIMRINKDGSCTKEEAASAAGALNIFRSYKFKMGPRMSPPPPATVSPAPAEVAAAAAAAAAAPSSSNSISSTSEVQTESRMVEDLSTTGRTPAPVFTSSAVAGKRKRKESATGSAAFGTNLSQPPLLPKVLPSPSHPALPVIAPKLNSGPASTTTTNPTPTPQFILATQSGYIIVPQQSLPHNLLVAAATTTPTAAN
uniref:Uncharacterized protein n=1 Tax=Anopheles epiroticus TaxID=199890 RepID=A0A182PJI8_9DIPT